MTISNPSNRFKESFSKYESEIIRLLRRMGKVIEADNADSINGKDSQTLIQSGRTPLAAHMSARNPHQETAESIGSSLATKLDLTLSQKIPMSVIPISLYGIADELDDVGVAAVWGHSGRMISCGREMTVVMAGTVYNLPEVTLDVSTVSETSAPVYLYVKIRLGNARYLLSASELAESASTMLIGIIDYNGSTIVSKEIKSVIRLMNYRLSHLPVGSAIPVTVGEYSTPERLASEWIPL